MTDIGHRVPARAAEQFAERPGLRAVLRHLGLNLFVATIVPTALFYACLITAGLWAALIVALMWCYATLAWRLRRRQPTSVLSAYDLTCRSAYDLTCRSVFGASRPLSF